MTDRDIFNDGHGFRPFQSSRRIATMAKQAAPMTHRVFVYGTLKRGYGNYRMFLRDAHFAGEAKTPPSYGMLSAGGFPVVMPVSWDGKAVAGELYHVDDRTLARLDGLEGVRPDGTGM